MLDFSGKTVLITGAGSGIGREIAIAFSRAGADTVVADLNIASAEETVEMIRSEKGSAIFVGVNVTDSERVRAMIEIAVRTFGKLDVACNNAGVIPPEKLTADVSEEEWDKVLDVNLKGVWLCMKHQIPQLLKQPSPAIVNTASAVGVVGSAFAAPYVASKHGVIGLTKAAALDYADTGLRVNSVCPGLTETPLLNAFGNHVETLKEMIPVGRLGRTEEVANAVLWLASNHASYVTGHSMLVDGGFTVV